MRDRKRTIISLITAGVLLLASVALILYLKARSERPPEIRQGSVETRTIRRPVAVSGQFDTDDSDNSNEKPAFVRGVVIREYLVTNGTVVRKGTTPYRRRPENGNAERPRGCRAGDLGR